MSRRAVLIAKWAVACATIVALIAWMAARLVLPPIAVTFTNESNAAVSEVTFECGGNLEHVGTVAPGATVKRRMTPTPGPAVRFARNGLYIIYVDAQGNKHDEHTNDYIEGDYYRGYGKFWLTENGALMCKSKVDHSLLDMEMHEFVENLRLYLRLY